MTTTDTAGATGPLDRIAGRLTRARNLLHAMRAYVGTGASKMNYLEIGTAFKADEGLSTLLALLFLREKGLDGHVWSLESNPDHIADSRAIIEAEDHGLIDRLTHVQGLSTYTMPPLLDDIEQIDIAFIDGGGDARLNLFELELLLPKMSPNGVIVIDDVVWLERTGYRARRDFGKAQLILPLLCIADTANFIIDLMTERNDGDAYKALAAMPDMAGTGPVFDALVQNDALRGFWRSLAGFDFAKVGSQIFLARKEMMHGPLGFDLEANLIAARLPEGPR